MMICDVLQAGYKNPDYGNTNFMDLISNQKSKIFDFDYPIDPTIKDDFEKQFLLHFFNYDMAFQHGKSTMLSWKVTLAQRLNQIFPLYNQYVLALRKTLTGASENVSRETYDKRNDYNSDKTGTNSSSSNSSNNTTQNDSNEFEEHRVNRDFPNSSVIDTDKYMSDSYQLNDTTNATRNVNGIETNSQDINSRDITKDKSLENMDLTRTNSQGISDLDFVKRFSEELKGIYSEIFKYCIDLFIFIY